MKSRLSLGAILTSSLAALAALPILGIGLVTQHVVSRDLTARITRQNLILARTLAAEVTQFLDRPLLLLEEIRDNVARHQLVARNQVDGYLASVMRHHHRLFNMIVMLDERGLVRHIAPFNQDYIGVNWSRHTVFHRPGGGVRAHWSPTFISPRTGQPTLTISIPFGQGMLVGYLNLAVLRTITGRFNLGRGPYAAITDQRGTAIAYQDQAAVQQQVNLKDLEVIRQGLAGREGTYRFEFKGRSFLGSVAVVHRTGWAVAVSQPADEAFAMVSRMNKVVWLGTLISLILALAVGTWALRQVQRPLSRLVASSERIASGDYDFNPPRPGFREIDDLVRAFEAMSVAVKDREAALRESEKRYRDLVSSASEGILVAQDGLIRFANPAFSHLIGYPPEELVGRSILDFIHPDDRPLLLDRHKQRRQGEYPPSVYSFRALAKDGQVKWIEINAVVIAWEGQPATLNLLTDITERRQAEEALRESEARYRELFQGSPDAITISDLSNGLLLDVNEGFCQLSGYSRDEAIGRTVFDLNVFFDPGDRDEYLQALREEGKLDGYELQLRSRDGTVQDALLSARTLRYGGRDCLAAVVRDITPLKRTLQEKTQLEAQLQQAQKMEAVGTLAGGIAHDFNNILQAITGYVDVLAARQDQGPETRNGLAQIARVTERATDLVRRLLTFSRKVEPELRPVDLNHEVLQTVKILERTIPKMIEIETFLDPEVKLIHSDANQLEQVLLNLGTNAGDAMPQGGRLTIETRNTVLDEEYCRSHPGTAPGEYVRLSFSDTGHGMDEETQKFIFDPFYTTKEIGRGTGLGLAVVYGIVKNHGGAITCSSQPDQGTRFDIYLPALEEGTSISAALAPIREDIRGGTETILVVDDEPGVRETVREMLDRFGYQTLAAASGEQALELFEGSSPGLDLVILDLGMPGMGGYRCLERLRDRDPELRVIIASGYTVPLQEKQALAAGAVRFLAKPYRLSEMLRTVRDVLDHSPDYS
jgi:PAS domain S-box-containing protein